MKENWDTIAAIATPLGVGGVGIIRISGDHAFDLLKTLFKGPKTFSPRQVHFGSLLHPESHVVIDEGCAIYFKGPSSYTGEDVVEFQVHGSPFILKQLLSLLISLGARLASPGEFTRRAFMNGKLSLEKAESIIDLIHSESHKSHAVAIQHLKGKLGEKLAQFRTSLRLILEQVEGSIDFPEEVPEIDHLEVTSTLTHIQTEIGIMLNYQDFGKRIHDGIFCLIMGQPNAGKSSLLNQMLGENRAIVTEIPGTTRDFIESEIELGGIRFKLVDTAGIRDATDTIEALGIQKIDTLIRSAAAIFWVIDGSTPITPEEMRIFEKIKAKSPIYALLNKCDQSQTIDTTMLPNQNGLTYIPISAKTGEGIDVFKHRLYKDFVESIDHINLDLICNIRQIGVLNQLHSTLNTLLENIDSGLEDDLLSADLKAAILKLGELTGEEVTEEVLDGIFARFCVGK